MFRPETGPQCCDETAKTEAPIAITKINTHKANTCNDLLDIVSFGPIGPGGAPWRYRIYHPLHDGDVRLYEIRFQNGPIPQCGVNGLTQEALLAIVQDRLECFQAGPYACPENQDALEHIRAAIAALHHRTLARQQRGVEGTLEK